MASQVQILNMALHHLGQGYTEQQLNVETIREATRKLMVYMETAREYVLGEHDWLEARTHLILNAEAVTGYVGFAYVYALPERFVRVSEIAGCERWEMGLHIDGAGNEKRVIFADGQLSRASIIIAPKWETLSVHLALAVSLKLAELGCNAVTGGIKIIDSLKSRYTEALVSAATAEAWNTGGYDDEPDMPSFQNYRRQAI